MAASSSSAPIADRRWRRRSRRWKPTADPATTRSRRKAKKRRPTSLPSGASTTSAGARLLRRLDRGLVAVERGGEQLLARGRIEGTPLGGRQHEADERDVTLHGIHDSLP